MVYVGKKIFKGNFGFFYNGLSSSFRGGSGDVFLGVGFFKVGVVFRGSG